MSITGICTSTGREGICPKLLQIEAIACKEEEHHDCQVRHSRTVHTKSTLPQAWWQANKGEDNKGSVRFP